MNERQIVYFSFKFFLFQTSLRLQRYDHQFIEQEIEKLKFFKYSLQQQAQLLLQRLLQWAVLMIYFLMLLVVLLLTVLRTAMRNTVACGDPSSSSERQQYSRKHLQCSQIVLQLTACQVRDHIKCYLQSIANSRLKTKPSSLSSKT